MTPVREPARPLPAHRAFVVQFSAETNAELGHFGGRVEHVVSGQARRFTTLDDLLSCLVEMLVSLGTTTPEGRERGKGSGDSTIRAHA